MKNKILLIDDDIDLSKKLGEVLKNEKYDIIFSFNGKDGFEKALKIKPDLIISDISMPIMDGISMLKKLREDEWGKNVAVIILTNINSTRLARYSFELYARDYLIKSKVTFSDVLNIVDNFFNHNTLPVKS